MLAVCLAAVILVLPEAVPALGATASPAGGPTRTAGQTAGHAPRTVVSLTFDDGDADQMAAARMLHRYRLPATFYIITGAVGTPGYVTRSDLRQLAGDGNEIGGHTVSHLRLTALTTAEARRQVCESRSILARWGYRANSFAYPGGADSPRTEAIVRACGYTSGRGVVGLRAPGCPGCALTESIPPRRSLALRTAGEVDSSWTLRDLQRTVTAAEAQGGWLPLVFHHVCGGSRCGGLAVRAGTLDAFARWLAQRQRLGTAVRTVGQMTGGTGAGITGTGGPVAGSAAHPTPHVAPAAPHGIVNASLESVASSGAVSASLETTSASSSNIPRCWMQGGYGANTARWQHARDHHAGRWAERLTITSYHSGDAKLLPRFDLGECSLPVRRGPVLHARDLVPVHGPDPVLGVLPDLVGALGVLDVEPVLPGQPGLGPGPLGDAAGPGGRQRAELRPGPVLEGLADHGLVQLRGDPAQPDPADRGLGRAQPGGRGRPGDRRAGGPPPLAAH